MIVIIAGVDGAGKGETVNLLNEWMDARHIQTHVFKEPTDEERERPEMWRFWRALPPKGKIGIFFGAWHTLPILRCVYGETKKSQLDASLQEIVRLERMLADEGALIVKLWFHLSKKDQRKRLKALSKDKRTRWRVTERDWKHFALYDDFRKVSERSLRQTSTAHAPWTVIEGGCPRYRALAAGNTLLTALRQRLDRVEDAAPAAVPALPRSAVDGVQVLKSLDMSATTDPVTYEKRLEELQGKLAVLSRHKKFEPRSVVCVFEGNDAAGKGGAIRRVTGALDAWRYTLVPIAAPTDEERAQPYLWRFWRHVGRRGRFTIFDRSWYGRVLVERVEGFAKVPDWSRAYQEINDFEGQLRASGAIVFKFWLSVSKDVQLQRFQEREATGFKRYKITPEDWRNREKWDAYTDAVGEMIERTSTEIAPWTIVGANDKYHARLQVLETLCRGIEDEL